MLAERCSKELGMTSVVMDKRDHIGGNCYDYVTSDGIRASKYGAHLFHTKFERVWEYVNRFSEWMPFDHRVKGRVPDKDGVKQLVPIPPTQETVNVLFGVRGVAGDRARGRGREGERQMVGGKFSGGGGVGLCLIPLLFTLHHA